MARSGAGGGQGEAGNSERTPLCLHRNRSTFLLHWPVPPGMEHDDAHKLQFSPAEDARLHILPKAEVDRQIKAGVYPTAVICDDDRSTEVEGWKVYSQKADYQDCNVFWQLEKHSPPKPGS